MASIMSRSESETVSITIFVSGRRGDSSSSICSPLMPGRSMSSSTMSGRTARARAKASSAVAASATSSTSGALMAWLTAERTSAWSSTSMTRRAGVPRSGRPTSGMPALSRWTRGSGAHRLEAVDHGLVDTGSRGVGRRCSCCGLGLHTVGVGIGGTCGATQG